jgi:hypothetical protein
MSARKPSQPPDRSPAVFVLDIDGRPTLAFEAGGPAEAQEIARDADLWADLAALTSDGAPLCTPCSTFGLRLAAREEIAAFRHAVGRAPASDQPTMTFLVKIDGVVVVTVGPEQA